VPQHSDFCNVRTITYSLTFVAHTSEDGGLRWLLIFKNSCWRLNWTVLWFGLVKNCGNRFPLFCDLLIWFGLFVYPFSHICDIGHVNYRLQFTTHLVIYRHLHNTVYDMIWYIFNCNWVAIRWQLFSTHIRTNNTGNVTKQTIQRTQTIHRATQQLVNNNTIFKDLLEVKFVTTSRVMCVYINIPKS